MEPKTPYGSRKVAKGPKVRASTVVSDPPDPPAWLSDGERAVFVEACSQCVASGAGIARADVHLLAAYAAAVTELRAAREAMKGQERYYTGPNGAICTHPAVRETRQAIAEIVRMATALGIGATARKRNNSQARSDKEPVDPLAKYKV